MNITSLIVRARPERMASLSTELAEIPGVDIHAQDPGGRMVITVEDAAGASAADTMVRVHQLAGVIATSLVYQYSDEVPAGKETQK